VQPGELVAELTLYARSQWDLGQIGSISAP
jgi:hypothetical protein